MTPPFDNVYEEFKILIQDNASMEPGIAAEEIVATTEIKGTPHLPYPGVLNYHSNIEKEQGAETKDNDWIEMYENSEQSYCGIGENPILTLDQVLQSSQVFTFVCISTK